MRNFKKLFAVIMVVAMLASIMVPAFAADYESDALKLKALGLFKGYSDADLGLEDILTREQGLTFMLRAKGLEDEVKAMSAEEIAAQLAKVTDLDTVTEWAKPYVAYAVKNGLTKGINSSIAPNVEFAGQLLLTGKEFINFMLNAMGYEEDWDNVLTKAADVGMLTAGKSVIFGSINELKRDTAAGIIAFAMGGTTASGVTLAQALVDSGAVDADAMAEAGYFTPTVAPTEAPVELAATASTDNLKQLYVEYSEEVDADSAKSKDNYALSKGKIKDIALKDDGITVVITLEEKQAQQAKVDLTIKNVKTVAGTVIQETKLEGIEFFDTTPPEVIDVEVVGKDTFKVIYSEPMSNEDKANFEVNSGKLYVKSVSRQTNDTEMLVTMYSSFKEGDVTIKVKRDNEDYAGFGVREEVFTRNVVKDVDAPVVVGYEKASPTEVVLLWSEDIVKIAKDDSGNYYHTNANNKPSTVTVDGNKMTLTFDKKYCLPPESAYVYILKDSVKDLWDNKNAQEMIKVDVVVDETAPEVKEVKQGDYEDEVVVTYTEAMDATSTKKAANYTILDDEGEEQKDLVKSVTLSDDAKKATLKLSKKIGGDFSLVIEGVKDLAGNEIVSVATPFTVVDKTTPDPDDFTATLYNAGSATQMIKISFGESMAIEGKYSIDDIEKYQYEDGSEFKAIKGLKKVAINVVDNGKAVEITVPATVDDKANWSFTEGDLIRIARVADAADNYTADLFFEKALVITDSIEITAVDAIARDTVQLTFGDEVAFEIEDFTVTDGVYDFEYAEIETTLNSKGNTVATIKLTEKLPYTWAEGDYILEVAIPEDEEELGTENAYGVKVSDDIVNVADKIKPELIENDDEEMAVFENGTTNSTITLIFSEDLAPDTATKLYAHDLIVRKADGTALTPITDYTIAVDDDVITITVLGVDDLTDYSIESAATVRYIKGLDGNKMKAFEAIVNE